MRRLPQGAEAAGEPQVPVTGDLPASGSDLFVVRGDAQAEGGRLSVDTDTVEWFTDRPERRAGVTEVAQLADRWSEFGLVRDPPNAAVAGGSTQTVVELSDPRLDDGSISFAYRPLHGETLDTGDLGAVSVFVDNSVAGAGGNGGNAGLLGNGGAGGDGGGGGAP